ncbi:MAG: hypothetical protein ACOC5M_01820 [Chloroflexota bacterium]
MSVDQRGLPSSIRLANGGRPQAVASIEDTWKINDEWWRGRSEEVARVYFELLAADGQRVVVFQDLNNGAWFKQ